METNGRLKNVVKWLVGAGLGKNQQDIGILLGYKNKGSFSQILNGKVPVPKLLLDKICLLDKNINKVWLETGEGKMLKPIGLMNETEADKWENNPKVQRGEPLPSSVGQSDEYCRLFDSYTSALRAIEAQKETIAIQKERIEELKKQIKPT